MKKIIITAICCVTYLPFALSQYAGDALRLSQYYANGSARSVGMSGAFGALGGDLSVMSTNPGGLGVYRGSEFSFSPALTFSGTDALFDGVTYHETAARFIINNVGYVHTWNYNNTKGIQSLSFGIAYNRLSDFTHDAYIRSPRSESSMLDEFVWYANGQGSGYPLLPEEMNPFYEGLAWRTYALNEDDPLNPGFYYSDYTGSFYEQPIKRTMSTRGGVGEYDFSLAANFNHTLFFGATLGIQDVYYEEYYFHEEEPRYLTHEVDYIDDPHMDYFNFSDEYTFNGWGLNFKAGLIYRPIQMLRVGAAIHTPSYLWMKPYHLTGMETDFYTSPVSDGERYFFEETESDPSDRVKVTTPWRYSVSAAGVFGDLALADIDVEYADYSQCGLLPNSDFKEENDYAESEYQGAINIKGGVEFRLGLISLRAGTAYYGSPYKKDSEYTGLEDPSKGTMSYSGGIGIKTGNFYMDAGYSFTKYPNSLVTLYQTYDDLGALDVDTRIKSNANKIVLTFGFKF